MTASGNGNAVFARYSVYDIVEFAIRGIKGNASIDPTVPCCTIRVFKQERNENIKKGIFSISKCPKTHLS